MGHAETEDGRGSCGSIEQGLCPSGLLGQGWGGGVMGNSQEMLYGRDDA